MCLHLEKKYVSEFHNKDLTGEYGSFRVIILTMYITDNLFGFWPINPVNRQAPLSSGIPSLSILYCSCSDHLR